MYHNRFFNAKDHGLKSKESHDDQVRRQLKRTPEESKSLRERALRSAEKASAVTSRTHRGGGGRSSNVSRKRSFGDCDATPSGTCSTDRTLQFTPAKKSRHTATRRTPQTGGMMTKGHNNLLFAIKQEVCRLFSDLRHQQAVLRDNAVAVEEILPQITLSDAEADRLAKYLYSVILRKKALIGRMAQMDDQSFAQCIMDSKHGTTSEECSLNDEINEAAAKLKTERGSTKMLKKSVAEKEVAMTQMGINIEATLKDIDACRPRLDALEERFTGHNIRREFGDLVKADPIHGQDATTIITLIYGKVEDDDEDVIDEAEQGAATYLVSEFAEYPKGLQDIVTKAFKEPFKIKGTLQKRSQAKNLSGVQLQKIVRFLTFTNLEGNQGYVDMYNGPKEPLRAKFGSVIDEAHKIPTKALNSATLYQWVCFLLQLEDDVGDTECVEGGLEDTDIFLDRMDPEHFCTALGIDYDAVLASPARALKS